MNDLVSAKLVQIADQIQSTLVAKTPAPINLLLVNARISAWQDILCVFFVMCCVVNISVLAFIANLESYKKWHLWIIISFLIFLVLSIFGFFGSCAIFSIVGIFHPDIYIAHQLLGKVID